MNRFQIHKRKKLTPFTIYILVFAVILFVFIFSISHVSNATTKRQEASLINAIERNIIHCYALEGFYPPSLEYMETHYGLIYDKDMFLVDYQPIASNLYPDFTVITKGASR